MKMLSNPFKSLRFSRTKIQVMFISYGREMEPSKSYSLSILFDFKIEMKIKKMVAK